MFATEIAVMLVGLALAGTGVIVQALRSALPQAAAIRQALKDCPESREVRFTVREVIVSYNDGKVVPLRGRRAVSLPRPLPVRAAA
ncbi:MAG: hypothetical protein GXC70_01865 [Sphingomonadaceae bacterium]|nr:hypothetical protein [Sphingomonadaceae bacterium]